MKQHRLFPEQMGFAKPKNPKDGDTTIGCCPHTNKSIMMVYTQGEWLCLHQETREQELQEMQEYLKTH